jgi:CRISPR type III-B/RAMP module-associated protein Cmr5
MATLDQARAALAFEHIQKVKDWKEDERDKYASIVHGMPALIRSAGLSQALHFVRSRKDKNQRAFLGHLAEQLARVDTEIRSDEALLARVRGAELAGYLRLTREALACVGWYRRFVQGELGIQAGEADGGDT